MKPFLKNVGLPIVSAVIGGLAVVAALKISPELRLKLESKNVIKSNPSRDQVYDDIINQQKGIRHQFDSIFDDDFFGRSDPFAEMKKMREQMEKRMQQFEAKPHAMSNPFDSWFSDKFGGGTINDISKREDNGYVYYDITVDDVKSTSIHTKIENGYITITGTQEKDSKAPEKQDESYFSSSFSRTFPLPIDVDPNKMEMVTDKDKIILKFPKSRV